ncbi:MAG: c-type cytochrome [Gammaproteobacteria bacterium]|nr:c-type cytochrome [Gammaproteobacteria bacterium]
MSVAAGIVLAASCAQEEAPVQQDPNVESAPAQQEPAARQPAEAASTAQQESDQDLLARGDYLMNGIVGCGNCHSPRNVETGEFIEGMELAGAFVIEEPGFTAYAPNITPDEATGIGSWSDEDIERAVRQGIRPDGSVMGPPMAYPFYRDISDRDMRAIIAYLRSVPAVSNEVPASTYNIPLPPNWGPPVEGPVPEPSRDDQIEYGRYLTHTLGHCTDCHTPLVEGRHDFSRIGAGGNLFPMPFGYPWSALAANITQHPELGIGQWTDEEIKRAITQGISRDGRELLPFMGFSFYENITAEDLDAIVAYVKTLPPATAAPPQEH